MLAFPEAPYRFFDLFATIVADKLSRKAAKQLMSIKLIKFPDQYTHLRDYLENYPIESNLDRPLNPGGYRQYYIICTHCHFDHTGGITQFLSGGTTEIIASSAGRDFIESDLLHHGHFDYVDRPAPYYEVTHYAESFERLKWPIWHKDPDPDVPSPRPFQTDLGVSIIHTPGHTPDEIAWYDYSEMHLFVGDSFYEEGEDGMSILFPGEGNLIEWVSNIAPVQVMHMYICAVNDADV